MSIKQINESSRPQTKLIAKLITKKSSKLLNYTELYGGVVSERQRQNKLSPHQNVKY